MATRALLLSLLSNMFLTIIKVIVGFIGNSKALIADGIHSLSDLSTDIIAVFGNHFSNKPADEDHPYGHGKINYLTSVIIGICIVLIGITLFKNSFNYSSDIPAKITIIVTVITIVVKYGVSSLLIRVGKKQNNNILLASGKESFADVFSSILVLIVLVASQFTSYLPILKYTDMIGSIIISIIIIVMGTKILIENFSSLIGQIELSSSKIEEVLKFLTEKVKNVTIEEVLLLKYGTYYKAIVKILVNRNMKVRELKKISKNIENDLLNSEFNIKYVSIDVDVLKGSESNARITRSRNSKRNFKKKTYRKEN